MNIEYQLKSFNQGDELGTENSLQRLCEILIL